ncbi:MAG TPA: Asp-tRNA(Asn)/Glu-tRNA(Gln) amidotransferase GatCAB subunit C [Flavobacteriales bacterium]|nr:Asp-tRNA(Asn)/Glu-tRNA(Gln) amidotransferase GatCAB subunit C [Flavobacteriales bacterium]HRE74916.1 Asp-tRNA(Asn)/Glu-tRNA(Gln) amidotransferase subunit GatC [Flavobacteriales bacterium]HRE96194.1 Asp-tRNA(Asn)/Glu-tRNA(Gln) amidotransferase subunit GatC [Flavobacteriales bacterium]HRJ35724.1 Asp-tRNA(Asn)/Glu-tRNA(Gln) amidotransferase subunit GatC [Flavobacteriales bacterium]HRJ37474.1 Asp-tRNA(Asn)/Glu-tRNA(Gln) amidotransferase subunit GatC [Flavobacteriales bacterium]
MKIDEKTISRLAELSRLEFDPASAAEIQKDLTRIIGFIEKLNELDTEKVEPLIFMGDSENILREDVDVQTITQDEALKNAPRKDSDYFRIPKVLSK